MSNVIPSEAAIEGATAVGGGFLLFRVGQWLCAFLAGRFDARQLRLEIREKRLEASMGDRLRHLEDQVTQLRAELHLTLSFADELAIELLAIDPHNAKAAGVRRALVHSLRVKPGDHDGSFDSLLKDIK